jgi:hypothetical protein
VEKIKVEMPKQNCGSCAHAKPIPLRRDMECHGAPPSVIAANSPNGPGLLAVFPVVDSREKCAMWQEKTGEKPN